MTVRLATLVAQCGGRLDRAADFDVSGFAPPERARPDQLAFISDPKWIDAARATQAGALIVREDWAAQLGPIAGVLWLHPQPYLAFARVSQQLAAAIEQAPPAGVHPSSVVDSGAQIAPDASIGPMCTIGAGAVIASGVRIGAGCAIGRNVQLGAGTLLHARVTIYDGCRIGAQCILHSGAVIGADGFGYARDGSQWIKIPQTGAVRIGDRVEIGANTSIDRGALDDTIIEDGVKLDNQIQIGHNCVIGEDTAMAGCVGVAGSTRIGKRCTFGGAAMVFGHLEIGDDVHISGATVVNKSIRESGRHTGYFPIDNHRAWERNAAMVRHLAELRSRLRALEAAFEPDDSKEAKGDQP